MKQTLTLEQCKALIRSISTHGSKQAKAVDHALVVSVLMCGADARTWTWQDALANPIFQPFAVYEAIFTELDDFGRTLSGESDGR